MERRLGVTTVICGFLIIAAALLVRGITAPPPPPPPTTPAIAAAAVVPAPEPAYAGNTNTHKFHRRSCRYFDCPNCTAKFKTREEAIEAGYRPCGTCSP
ncbi:MAG TPA: hypothetical protein VF698_19575 [Thermoanaerobaculia bacterium]|jgi:hypothetical protein